MSRQSPRARISASLYGAKAKSHLITLQSSSGVRRTLESSPIHWSYRCATKCTHSYGLVWPSTYTPRMSALSGKIYLGREGPLYAAALDGQCGCPSICLPVDPFWVCNCAR